MPSARTSPVTPAAAPLQACERAIGTIRHLWVDRIVAGIALILTSPIAILRGAAGIVQTGRLLEPRLLRDHSGNDYIDTRFSGRGPGTNLPRLLLVLTGRLALAGPRPLPTPEYRNLSSVERDARATARCGLVSPHQVRERLGIAYESEIESDLEWSRQSGLRQRMTLLLKATLAMAIGSSASVADEPEIEVLGVRIDNLTMDDAVRALTRHQRSGAHQVAFVNPDCLNLTRANARYRQVLAQCDLVLPDGIGLQIAGRILGHTWKGNLNGTDLFPKLCQEAATSGRRLFFLGARPGIAEAAAEEMIRRFPTLQVVGTSHGYFDVSEEAELIEMINSSGAEVLLVAMGAPQQDLWLAEHADALEVPVRLGVGGLFDFYSGRIQRAPRHLQDLGLEWAWRLLQEPGRMWKRYLIGNPLFLMRVLGQKVSDPRPTRGDLS